MKNRPVIKVAHKPIDRLVEYITIVLLIAPVVLLIVNYGALTDGVPMRYDTDGSVSSSGSAAMLIVLSFVSIFTYSIMTLLSFFPHTHNYPVNVTPENAPALYALSKRLLLHLKLICTALFSYLIYGSIQIGLGNIESINSFILWGLIALSVLYPLSVVIKMNALKDTSEASR
jgi:hypothetical protein